MAYCFVVFAAWLSLPQAKAKSATQKYNVLHVIVDDLRPEIGPYGVGSSYTPNLNKWERNRSFYCRLYLFICQKITRCHFSLAKVSVTFDRAYCQQAVCAPSRNSFLTGRRPDRSRVWNFENNFREDHPDWTTLPGIFLNQPGSISLGVGKTFHPGIPPGYDGNRSWSLLALPYRAPCWTLSGPCIPCPIDIEHYLFKKNTSVGNDWCEIDAYEDTIAVDVAIGYLRLVRNQHFYLAVGLRKPHLPWQASPDDFSHHPLDSISLAKHPKPPKNMPDVAFRFTEEKAHADPWHPIPDDYAKKARRAYRAAVTGMDRKLGKLLKELDDLGLTQNTAIVFHSDHGWQLGEHGEWRKFTNFELATRVPLIISAPWLGTKGRSSTLVELVDLLPTIAELAGVDVPKNESFDGQSLVPLLARGGDEHHHNSHRSSRRFNASFSQYPRVVTHNDEQWKSNAAIHKDRTKFTHMGYSVRTEDWRHTEWIEWDGKKLQPKWTKVTGAELYDHRGEVVFPTDFDEGENENVVDDPNNGSVVKALSNLLRSAFSDQGK
eukprot:CAMPEP_0197514732 /NCGR_PEP_ID=MMETSP1318-20131121/73_1 /TAXON_ID=552666 /ORGANISM="Partenskyella glossopodia, Strain RCC365" /LENGTH=546 /DNA_ID=CAMNT_0043062911 /DNA_START=280 /DNA_END=1920 /DNA_ORIENTATION=+